MSLKNFAKVSEVLYRGAQPDSGCRRQGLKKDIALRFPIGSNQKSTVNYSPTKMAQSGFARAHWNLRPKCPFGGIAP